MGFTGKDMFLLEDGRTYHLGVKKGDIHPRILTVGSASRALRLAGLLDNGKFIETKSERQFTVYSGTYKGVGVSIVSIGMGAPMMDFMIRESSFILNEPLVVIRVGTCGITNKSIKAGTVMVASKGSLNVQTNYDHFCCCPNTKSSESCKTPYNISNGVPADEKLSNLLTQKLTELKLPVHNGLNASCDTFYSCQGRHTDLFDDKNDYILDTLVQKGVDSLEMETHQLLFLAKRSVKPFAAAACAIGIVNRLDESANVTTEMLHNLEHNCGAAALNALIEYK